MKNGIVVIGPVFVDVKGYPLDKYVPAGRNSGRVEFVHGGVSRNIAEDIANVELCPTFISLVDDNGTGTDVIEKLRRHKVNTDYIRKVRDGMGTWLAVFDNSGDVVASISKRPDLSELKILLEERGNELIENCDSIALEIDMDRDIVGPVIDLAEKYGKDIYAVVSNMSIAVQRRDFLKHVRCLICNLQEAGILFSEDYSGRTPGEMEALLLRRIVDADISGMVVTMGGEGAVWAEKEGDHGFCPALPVEVRDTTGAGDAFFAGVCLGCTYGLDLGAACSVGTRLAATVVRTVENVCPRFRPSEFGLNYPDGQDKKRQDP